VESGHKRENPTIVERQDSASCRIATPDFIIFRGCGQVRIQPKHDEAHDAFVAYAKAKERAEATMAFADAQAAGRAWATFLNTFLDPAQRMPLPTARVINFPRGKQ
jgi:hypothetical protein